jgi:hypothetical protein
MKFKIMLLVLPFMAITTLFTFCTKEQDSTTAKAQTDTIKEEATDRGGPCSIILSATGLASICGTTNGTGTCTNCSGAAYAGLASFGTDAGLTHTFASSMLNGTAAIRNISGEKNLITVTINGVVTQQVLFQPGDCRSTSFTGNPCTFVIN